jgi:PAS domain S-box-containing protein
MTQKGNGMGGSADIGGEVDYRHLFEAGGVLWLVLLPNMTIVAVSDAYLQATMTKREELVGRHMFEVFPDDLEDSHATGSRNLRISVERVLRTRMADVMAIQRYDIRRPAAEGGALVERYWSVVNMPVLGPEGSVAFVVHRLEDVTGWFGRKEGRPAGGAACHEGRLLSEGEFVLQQEDARVEAARLREELRRVEEQFRERTAELDKTLRESEELFETAPSGRSKVDPERRFVKVNKAVCDMLGYSREELLGMRVDDLTYGEDRALTQKKLGEIFRGQGERYAVRRRYKRKDGSLIWVDITVNPVRRADGTVAYVSGVMMDVTEKVSAEEALRESEERFRGLLTASSQAIYRMNADWTEMEVLQSQMSPAQTKERSAKWLDKHIPLEDQRRVIEAVEKAIRTKGTFELEHQVIREGGKVGWLHSRAVPLLDSKGEVKEWFGFATDVTERKRLEAELRQAAEELKRSNQDLEQFAHVASHDLQEPLRQVKGHLDLIRRRMGDTLEESVRESMGFAIDGAERMQVLIRDLLAYSRVGRQEEKFAEVEMSEVLTFALANLEMAAKRSGAVIEHEDLPKVVAAPGLMRQLLQNLVGNALKYHARDRVPRVYVGARREKGGWVIFVRDNGIGIAREYQERVFMPFRRLHTRSEYPGTGLGLAICKRIVELHGGRIWVESEVGRGATFYFTVPERSGE